MATNTVTTSVQIVGNALSLTKATNTAKKDMNSLSNAVSKTSTRITNALGAVGIAFGLNSLIDGTKKAIFAASDLEQSYGAVESVFKSSANEIKEFSKSSLKLGLSQKDAANSVTFLGTMLKGAGLPMKEVVSKSKQLVTLGSDLAATYGGTTADAVKALSSVFKGEFDPIERYGVSIKQSDVNARLAAKGYSKAAIQTDKLARAQAVAELLMEKTTDAQGQSARESESFAGVVGRLQAAFENISAQIGQHLLPTMSGIASWVEANSGNISKAVEMMFNSKPVKAIGEMLKIVWEKIFIPIGEWFMSKEVQKAFGGFFDNVSRVLTSVGDFLGSPLGQFIGWLTSKTLLAALQTVSGLIGGIADAMDRLMGKNVPAPAYGGASLTGNVGTKYSFMDAINKGVGNLSTVGGKVTNNNSITINTKANAKDTVDELDRYFNRLGVKWR